MRVFEQHVRDGEIEVCQIGSKGLPWRISKGLWGPASLKRWTSGLVLDGGPFSPRKIFADLKVLCADAQRIYPGCTSEAVGHERPPASTRPRRGPRPGKSKAVERAMQEKIELGTLSIEVLRESTEEALVADFGYSRPTVRRARKSVLVKSDSISE
jgi:hypothetical protein